ncbi:hypothetical protein FQR65_LT11227 [Abscondita terminalis]|nr:hypothetical protein FQR65_LT11227 [Abscondita terminalis]
MATALNLVPPTDSDTDENMVDIPVEERSTHRGVDEIWMTPAKTVGEMRQDLIGFIRAGKRPLQNTRATPKSTTTAVYAVRSSDNRRRLEQAKIHKWKLSFTWKK